MVGKKPEDPCHEPPAAGHVGMRAFLPDGAHDLCRRLLHRSHPKQPLPLRHRRVDEAGLDVGDDDGEPPGGDALFERLEIPAHERLARPVGGCVAVAVERRKRRQADEVPGTPGLEMAHRCHRDRREAGDVHRHRLRFGGPLERGIFMTDPRGDDDEVRPSEFRDQLAELIDRAIRRTEVDDPDGEAATGVAGGEFVGQGGKPFAPPRRQAQRPALPGEPARECLADSGRCPDDDGGARCGSGLHADIVPRDLPTPLPAGHTAAIMKTRSFGRTGWHVTEIGFGAWAIGGGQWGGADERESMAALHAALDAGINFFDTADVYGDGLSERLISRLRHERSEPFYVATKAGRRLSPHTADGYDATNLTAFVDRSLTNLGVETLDLVQLHCPPTDVYYRPEVFEALDGLVKQGKIRFYGVSVEKVEEALKAIEYPGVQSVQIIFNAFRLRPAELFFEQAARRQVAVIARVPLASGLLCGKFSRQSVFPEGDHRLFNRQGAMFDRGETFSGVDYQTGLAAVDRLRGLLPEGMSLTQFALRWILSFDAVTTVIPGGRRPEQVIANAEAADLPPLDARTMAAVQEIYDDTIRPLVHHRW